MAGTIIVENPPKIEPKEPCIKNVEGNSATSGMAFSGADVKTIVKSPAFWMALGSLAGTIVKVLGNNDSTAPTGEKPAEQPELAELTFDSKRPGRSF